jgi:hypothetical protein
MKLKICLVDIVAGFLSSIAALFGALLLDFLNLKFGFVLTWIAFLVIFLFLYVSLSFRKTRQELGIQSYIYSVIVFAAGSALSIFWISSISSGLKGFG